MWYTMDVQETIKKLKTNAITGLSEVEANERIEKYGENVLKEKRKEKRTGGTHKAASLYGFRFRG